MISTDMQVWKTAALLILLCVVGEAAGGSPYLRAAQRTERLARTSSSSQRPTAITHNTAKLTFEVDCEAPWRYVTGPATPYRFPSQAESEAMMDVQESKGEHGSLHPGDEYLLVDCGEGSSLTYSLFPRSRSRKIVQTPSPSIILLSLPSLPSIPSLPLLQVQTLLNHHLSSSLFDQPDSTGFPAFSPLPRADIWQALSSAGYSTMAVIPHCDVNVDTHLHIDWLGYEFFCTLENLDAGREIKTELAQKAAFDYIEWGLKATSALFAYISLANDINDPSYLSTLISTIFQADRSAVLILESSSGSVVISSAPLPLPLYSTSQNLEYLLLTLTNSPLALEPEGAEKCGQRGVWWWSCEAVRQVPAEVLEGLVQQVETEMRRKEGGEICREKQVDKENLVVRTSSPAHLSLHFTLSEHPFVALFLSASSLLSPWQLSSILPLSTLPLCAALLQRPKPAYCVC